MGVVFADKPSRLATTGELLRDRFEADAVVLIVLRKGQRAEADLTLRTDKLAPGEEPISSTQIIDGIAEVALQLDDYFEARRKGALADKAWPR